MSSIFARGHRICRSTIPRLPQANVTSRRHLQLNVVPASTQTQASIVEAQPPSLPTATEKRLKRFETLYEFVQGEIVSTRAGPSRGIRSTSWNRLLSLVQTPLQLEMIVEMFPRWREMGRSFRGKDSELFARRCEELNSPLLALCVFSNHPKYGFPLSTDLAALQLIHSLYLDHPLQETITASALIKVNDLTPISSSLPGCAMLVAACLHSDTHSTEPKDPRARELANSLLPVLQNLCAVTPSDTWTELGINDRRRFEEKPKIWTVDALRTIERVLKEEGKAEYKWVRKALMKFGREGGGMPLLGLTAPKRFALAVPAPDEMGVGAMAVAEA